MLKQEEGSFQFGRTNVDVGAKRIYSPIRTTGLINQNKHRKGPYLYSCTLNLAGVQECCFEYRPAKHLDGSFLSRKRHVSVSFPGHVPTHWPTFICCREQRKSELKRSHERSIARRATGTFK